MSVSEPLLRTEGLTRHFRVGGLVSRQMLHAVDDVSLEIGRGEIVALVGESGSGKSTIARLLAKVYEPTDDPVRINIPERRHDLLADLLLQAVVEERSDEPAAAGAVRVARDRGTEVGAEERTRGRLGRLGAERALTVAQAVLSRHGFEPHREGRTSVRLRNCPFHPLAAKEPALVCGVNHAFVSGFLNGLGALGVQAVLVPTPGECCVRLSAPE